MKDQSLDMVFYSSSLNFVLSNFHFLRNLDTHISNQVDETLDNNLDQKIKDMVGDALENCSIGGSENLYIDTGNL